MTCFLTTFLKNMIFESHSPGDLTGVIDVVGHLVLLAQIIGTLQGRSTGSPPLIGTRHVSPVIIDCISSCLGTDDDMLLAEPAQAEALLEGRADGGLDDLEDDGLARENR